MSLKVSLQRALLLFAALSALFLASGCGSLSRRNQTASDAEAKEEQERKEKAERCSNGKKALDQVDSKADEYARLPTKTQLTTQPYLKGRLFIVESRDKHIYVYDYSGPGCRLSKECSRDAGCSAGSYDKFGEIRARAVEEVGTVALIACRKVKRGDYVQTSGPRSGEKIPGYDIACELTLVDRTIPAVVNKRTFNSELLSFEDPSRLSLSGCQGVGRQDAERRHGLISAQTPAAVDLDDYLNVI